MTEFGWCHQCGTLQLLEDAPLIDWIGDGVPEACCVVCREDEPWAFAVFPMDDYPSLRRCAEQRHVTWGPPRCETCGLDPLAAEPVPERSDVT